MRLNAQKRAETAAVLSNLADNLIGVLPDTMSEPSCR
jgi:hypothetical protein